MFNHWATGLRSGLLPQVLVLQHQELAKKGTIFGEAFARVLMFGANEGFLEGLGRFWEASRMCFIRVSHPNGQVEVFARILIFGARG